MEAHESTNASTNPQLNTEIRPNNEVNMKSRDGDSNPGPELYKSPALPAELSRRGGCDTESTVERGSDAGLRDRGGRCMTRRWIR